MSHLDAALLGFSLLNAAGLVVIAALAHRRSNIDFRLLNTALSVAEKRIDSNYAVLFAANSHEAQERNAALAELRQVVASTQEQMAKEIAKAVELDRAAMMGHVLHETDALFEQIAHLANGGRPVSPVETREHPAEEHASDGDFDHFLAKAMADHEAIEAPKPDTHKLDRHHALIAVGMLTKRRMDAAGREMRRHHYRRIEEKLR